MTAGRANLQTRDWDDVGAAREVGVLPQSTGDIRGRARASAWYFHTQSGSPRIPLTGEYRNNSTLRESRDLHKARSYASRK